MVKTNEAKWYVINTYTKYENTVANELAHIVKARNLQNLIQEIKVPKSIDTVIKRGKLCTVENVLFPQYVFVKMIDNEECRYIIRNIRGSYGLLCSGYEPVPLSDKEIAQFGVDKVSTKLGFEKGDKVKIIKNYLKGYSGIVDKVDLINNSVFVIISSGSSKITAELELDQVALDE